MGSLSQVLAGIPGLAGYEAQNQLNREKEMGALQQAGGAMSLMDVLRKNQQQQAYQAEVQGLGANPTQEQLVGVSSRFASPDKLMDVQQKSLDRQAASSASLMAAQERIAAQMEIAKQRGADQRTLMEMQMSGRKELAQLAASMRQPPQVQPLVQIMTPDGPRWVERKDAVNQVPAGAGSKAENVMAGKSDVDKDVMSLKTSLDALNAGGGITSTEKGVIPNIGSAIANSGVGQILGRAGGTYNQKDRDIIKQSRPLLLRSIMQATGMSAKQLDSNAELKLWLSTATDPDFGYEANAQALNSISEKYGSGGFMANTAKGKITNAPSYDAEKEARYQAWKASQGRK